MDATALRGAPSMGQRNLVELGNARDDSSVSDPASAGAGMALKGTSDGNARKRKEKGKDSSMSTSAKDLLAKFFIQYFVRNDKLEHLKDNKCRRHSLFTENKTPDEVLIVSCCSLLCGNLESLLMFLVIDGTGRWLFLSVMCNSGEDVVSDYYQQQVEMLDGFNEMDALTDRGFLPGIPGKGFLFTFGHMIWS